MERVIGLLLTVVVMVLLAAPISASEIGAEDPIDSSISICAVDRLQFSTVAEPWTAECERYNCYAYVMGVKEFVEPGKWSREGYPDDAFPIQIANVVAADLEELRYTNVRVLTADEFQSGFCAELLIAVRLRSRMKSDYHFMRYDFSDNAWYHKPDNSAILQYIGDPLASYAVWSDEKWVNGQYTPEALRYDSAIVCIAAGIEHHYNRYTYCGNNRHILTCLGCTLTTGSPVACTMINNTCSRCGHSESTGGGFDIMTTETP